MTPIQGKRGYATSAIGFRKAEESPVDEAMSKLGQRDPVYLIG
jgi:hypothetical protein